jgi:hypothetical protein
LEAEVSTSINARPDLDAKALPAGAGMARSLDTRQVQERAQLRGDLDWLGAALRERVDARQLDATAQLFQQSSAQHRREAVEQAGPPLFCRPWKAERVRLRKPDASMFTHRILETNGNSDSMNQVGCTKKGIRP